MPVRKYKIISESEASGLSRLVVAKTSSKRGIYKKVKSRFSSASNKTARKLLSSNSFVGRSSQISIAR